MSIKVIASSFIVISYLIYSLIFIVPFLPVTVSTKGLLIGIVYFGSWIVFGLGLFMGGKEALAYSKRLNLKEK
jgi:hypothetical protein